MRVLLLKNLTDQLGRKYKKEELLYNLMKINKPLFGEFGPSNNSSTVIENVTHELTNIRFDENDDLYGDVTIANTRIGKMFAEVVRHCPDSVRFGIRAYGTVIKNEVSDLELVTFDVYLDS